MGDELVTFALKNTLNEIRGAYPAVTSAFIFKNAKTLVTDENTDATTARNAANALKAIVKRANALGNVETVALHAANSTVNVAHIENAYLTTVTTEDADQQQINTLARVLIPIVLRLVAKIHPASIATDFYTLEETEPAELPMEETPTAPLEPTLPQPPVTQLIVDNLNGLLAPQDTVRIDHAIIAQWQKLYPNKKIEKAEVAALNGRNTNCKIKPIKDSKQEEQGKIQMPEKTQQILQTKKGELVLIKPIIN
ncbi:MAG: hypothetical protein NWE94_01300 [Candidatus Bathyarchaeota archaeon]|nr:hypothetical protein [Candidatus Bathyarchaeota archaeon]